MQPATPGTLDLHVAQRFRVGPAVVDRSLNQIRVHGKSYKLEPRVMRVLECLAAQAGEVVTRETLLERVWADRLPQDEGLTQAVCKLRKAFGDRATQARVVETIPKVGYRLIVPVSMGSEVVELAVNGKESPPRHDSRWAPGAPPLRPAVFGLGVQHAEWRWLAVCFALLILFCGLWSTYLANQTGHPVQRRVLIHDRPAPSDGLSPGHAYRVRIMTFKAPLDVHKVPGQLPSSSSVN